MARLSAGVRKRPDGTFEKRFTISGKRYSVYGTSKQIEEKEKELRKKVELGLYTENRNIILDKYFEELIEQKKTHVKENTIKEYKSHYNVHISPILGKKKIQNIERREIIQFQKALTKKDLSITTINMIMKVLKIIFNEAIKDEIIIKNPVNGIKSITNKNAKASETYHRALTEDEQKVFMNEAKQEYYYELYAFMLCSGMRVGEVGALMWKDIDYKKNIIHINKTLSYNENSQRIIGETPKTDSSKRDIPLTKILKDILKSWENKLGTNINMPIFTTVYGNLIDNKVVNVGIDRTLKRLNDKGYKIGHFTTHAFRDTYATRFIENGGNPQTLKTLLGHSSLAMTMDLYAHVLPNTKQHEAELIKFDIAL